jgi:hypothetical protein
MEPVPDADVLPVAQAPPAGHTAAAAHFLREVLPGNTGFEHKENPREGGAVWDARPSAFGLGRLGREQRGDLVPEPVGEKRSCHTRSLP